MSPIRAAARPLLASMFVTGGVDALRHPGPKVEAVRGAGLGSPETIVRASAGVDIVAGLALARGRMPRLSALLLAGSLAPSTYVAHPFWSEKDKDARKQQQVHFFKNLGLLGGLLMTVADTGGRESLPHAAGRVSHKAGKASAKAAKKATKKASKHT
ncbi:MAG: DoxX [Frankiales bacterium]|nr:DoxX [Frankiales bacterium]